MTTPVRIGCAGWSLPRESAPHFPTAGSHLERYAAVFGAAEINSSFYKPHQPATYARWAAATPPGFRFAVKLPRGITHDARLRGIDDTLARFAGEAGALEAKLGVVLVQLPPKLALERADAEALFAALGRALSATIACEARHASWFTPEATSLLRDAGVVRVLADPPVGYSGPFVPTSDIAYVRLHGSPRIYYSRYTAAQLEDVRAYLAARPGSWCIFDNTAGSAAVPNALELTALLAEAPPRSGDHAASPARAER